MTPLQRFVQYVIIFSTLVNVANLAINGDRYFREMQRDRPIPNRSPSTLQLPDQRTAIARHPSCLCQN